MSESNRDLSPGRGVIEERSGSLKVWCLVLIAAYMLFHGLMIPDRRYDTDEFEHMHAAWCVAQGLAPYEDFFEHHTPWMYFCAAPVVKLFAPERGICAAEWMLHTARGMSWFLTCAAIGLMVWIGKRWRDTLTGCVAGLLLLGIPIYMDKAFEVRPDAPALVLWLLCLGMVLSGVSGASRSRRRRWMALAGVCWGAAMMFTQKMLFAAPGLVFGLAWWAWAARPTSGRGERLKDLLVFGVGCLMPGVLTLLSFAVVGAADEFIYRNFTMNMDWAVRIPPDRYVEMLCRQSWPVLLLGWIGVLTVLSGVWNGEGRDWFGEIVFWSLAGLVAGLWIIPVAMRQYYMMLLPLAAFFAARGLMFVGGLLPARLRGVVLLIGIVVLQYQPVRHLPDVLGRSNEGQLEDLRFVFENSGPDELVMDGWRGMGVFRPHAFYYYFLHPEIRAMVPPDEWSEFIGRLESGDITPKLVVMDENLRAMGGGFDEFLKENYRWDAGHKMYVKER
ncbi:MAG: glycosyltransferase family 39 protein [Verrucomicrobia bacterium]|nr:glycosyltransferase family 39 protein [Verrucomicrobiota bacterium]